MSKTVLFALIGAGTGLIASQLGLHIEVKNIGVALFAFCLLVSSFMLLRDKVSTSTLIKFLALLAVILTFVTVYYFSQGYHILRRNSISPIFIIGLIQITIISTTFFQSWKTTKPHYNYENLFENAWNNHFFIIFSGLLLGAFLAILALGSNLFDMVGFNASKWIWNPYVTPIIVGALLGAGIGISRDYDQLIFKFRSIFFALFKVLAYLSAAILILFALVLPFTIDNLFAHKNTSQILLSIVAISIILINALKDTEFTVYPKLSRRMFNIQIVLLPIFAGLSIYAIYLRIEQYGLMPNRIVALWVAILIGAYALGYLIQLIINKGKWHLGFASVNPPLAFFWVLSIVLLASPLLDPIKLSANSQVERLKSDKVELDKFDFYALKSRLGEPGENAIKDILTWNDHPKIELIKQKIANADSRNPKKKLSISVLGEAPDNLKQLKDMFRAWRCNETKPCFIKLMKLNEQDEKQPMVFYFNKQSNSLYRLTSEYYIYDRYWKTVATFRSDEMSKNDIEKTIQLIRDKNPKLIQPKFSDYEIDGIQLRQ